MSAHRDPDMVAEYAKNARMRGLKVIIAGAGLAAALPGVVRRAHRPAGDRRAADVVDERRRRAGRAAVDRPDAARACRWRCVGRGQREERRGARRAHPERVIARYTRPEIGAVWTDEARFGAMRDVEIAAAEALERPDRGGPRRDPRVDLHGRRDQRAREDPRPRHGGVRRRARGERRAGRALDPLRAHVLRRRRHRARAAAQAGGRAARPGAAHARVRAGREGARARGHAVRRPHARRARRADVVRPQARGLRDGGAPQRGAPGARVRPDHGRDLRRRRHVRDARPGVRGARGRASSA